MEFISTTLERRRYDHKKLEPCKRCFYTIMANYNGSLEAVDCRIHSVRYDMVCYVLESSAAGGRLGCLIRSPTTLQQVSLIQTSAWLLHWYFLLCGDDPTYIYILCISENTGRYQQLKVNKDEFKVVNALY
eukprot:scaffold37720_cov147-Skeletonema_marinoi.AAC.2